MMGPHLPRKGPMIPCSNNAMGVGGYCVVKGQSLYGSESGAELFWKINFCGLA